MSSLRFMYTASVLANGTVLVAGGSKFYLDDILSSCDLYDPLKGIGTCTGNMNYSRA